MVLLLLFFFRSLLLSVNISTVNDTRFSWFLGCLFARMPFVEEHSRGL